jgi:hypothetical protein
MSCHDHEPCPACGTEVSAFHKFVLQVEHQDNCGTCEYNKIIKEEHNRMVDEILVNGRDRWRASDIQVQSERVYERWEQTKYMACYNECVVKGLDWALEFEKRGWQP